VPELTSLAESRTTQPSAAATAPTEQPLDLSPSAVARSCYADVCAVPSAPDGPVDGPTRIQDVLESQLDQHLSVAANGKPYGRRREPPQLQHGSDGTLRYEGPGILATIHRDGTVEFRDVVFPDRPPVQLDDVPPGLAPEYREIVKRVRQLFVLPPLPDLNDAVARLNRDDPYAEEKRWFLRETEAVRTKLANDYRMEEARRAERKVIGELRGILSRSDLDADGKRAAVFAIWESCSGDGDDERWQRIVEAFIRERMPASSELAYAPALIAKLNASRRSGRRFAPYE
jgi:hypothetical protein